jgi:hypothetical protein
VKRNIRSISRIQLRTLDLDRARLLLHGVASLAKEAAESRDPLLIMTAMAVLARQAETVRELEGR